MATSGSLTTSKYDGRYYKLAWERTSYSVTNNTSTIKWTLSAHGGNSSWYAERTLEVKIAGKTVKSKTSSVNRYTGTIDSGTLTITHNTDGSKSFSASVRAAVYTSSVNCTGSETFKLTDIPRVSKVSATNAYVGQKTTITIKRASSDFKHTLECECDLVGEEIVVKTTATTYDWTIPAEMLYYFPNSKTKSCIIRCYTYTSGGTLIGSDETTITITAGSSYAPTLTPTVKTYSETQALTGDTTTLIAGYSEAAVSWTASAKYDATIKSVKVTNGSKYRTTAGDFTNCVDGEFVFVATDSRGLTKTVTKTLDVIPYEKPTITFKPVVTVDGVATLKASGGGYIGNFGAQSNAQNWKVQYRYKVSGGSYGNWTDFSTLNKNLDKMTYTASHTVTGLDYTKVYVFQARVVDLIQTVNSAEIKVNAMPVFDWGENDFSFNVPMSAPSATISGAVSAGSVNASGKISASNFGRTAWAIADCIDTSFTTGKVTSDNISGYVYHLKGMNFIYFRAIISNWKEAVSAGADAFSAIKLKDEYKPAANTALASYGSRNIAALMNVDANIRITPHDAIATTTDLYISGFYPLSSSSSLYNT